MRRTLFMLCLMLALACLGPSAYGKPFTVRVESKYILGDLDSKQEAREMALMQAKRMALEQAGTLVEGVSEVKDFSLSKDEIRALTAGIVAVEVLSEDWKMSGENLMVLLVVNATVDTQNITDHIKRLRESQESVEEVKKLQDQMAGLQKEMETLKSAREEEKKSEQSAEKESKEPVRPPSDGEKKKYAILMDDMAQVEVAQQVEAALARKDWDRALQMLDPEIAKYPNSSRAFRARARAYAGLKRYDQALADLDTAARLSPADPLPLFRKGQLLLHLDKNQKALEAFNAVIGMDSGHAKPFHFRGFAYLKLKKYRAAYEDFARACSMGHEPACEMRNKIKEKYRDRPIGNKIKKLLQTKKARP